MKPMKLAEIQNLLQDSIRSRSCPLSLSKLIIEKPPLSIPRRLEIYQNAYFIRLEESLRADFSETESLLGDDRFGELAISYIEETPSRFRDISEYGAGFPNFLAASAPEAFETAAKDWLHVLSMSSPRPENALAAEDIQNGAPFLIQRHPAVHALPIGPGRLVSYQSAGDVCFVKISAEEAELLDLFGNALSPNELESLVAKGAVSESLLTNKVSDWLGLSILFCVEAKR